MIHWFLAILSLRWSPRRGNSNSITRLSSQELGFLLVFRYVSPGVSPLQKPFIDKISLFSEKYVPTMCVDRNFWWCPGWSFMVYHTDSLFRFSKIDISMKQMFAFFKQILSSIPSVNCSCWVHSVSVELTGLEKLSPASTWKWSEHIASNHKLSLLEL